MEAKNLTKRGFMHFTFEDTPELIIDVHIYSGELVGEPSESDEMKPFFFHESEFPLKKMVIQDN